MGYGYSPGCARAFNSKKFSYLLAPGDSVTVKMWALVYKGHNQYEYSGAFYLSVSAPDDETDTDFSLNRTSVRSEVGIVRNAPANEPRIFPVPFGDMLNVECPMSKGIYTLHDITGRTLVSGEFNDVRFSIPTTTLPHGIYLISIATAKQVTWTKAVKE